MAPLFYKTFSNNILIITIEVLEILNVVRRKNMLRFFKKIWVEIRKVFCIHSYVRAGFRQEEENGVRYSIRHYKCKHCGKMVYADGRCDKYAAKAISPYHFDHEVV